MQFGKSEREEQENEDKRVGGKLKG